MPPALRAGSLSHWTTREVPVLHILKTSFQEVHTFPDCQRHQKVKQPWSRLCSPCPHIQQIPEHSRLSVPLVGLHWASVGYSSHNMLWQHVPKQLKQPCLLPRTTVTLILHVLLGCPADQAPAWPWGSHTADPAVTTWDWDPAVSVSAASQGHTQGSIWGPGISSTKYSCSRISLWLICLL